MIIKTFTRFCLIIFALFLIISEISAQQKIFKLRISDELKGAGAIFFSAQDNQGYMWFGSRLGGLFRYDGSKIISITNNPQNTNSLVSNWVVSIVVDSLDNLWIGTWAAGMDKYDRVNNTFKHFRHNASDTGSLSNDTVTAMSISCGMIFTFPVPAWSADRLSSKSVCSVALNVLSFALNP